MYFWTLDASGTKLIIYLDENNTEWWLGEKENDLKYLAWLEEGNTPEPWGEPDTIITNPEEHHDYEDPQY